ncbi:MAG: hypothetical protein EON54_08245 [Alcaligenaceae bacterium]|nr:MAG: hypothetical protein EON54_08245 [Alcaligenaceae bacterium]
MATLPSINLEIGSTTNSIVEIEQAATAAFAARGGNLLISASALSKRRGALHDAALLQVLISWARLSPNGKLKITGVSNPESSQSTLEECCSYSVGVGALSLAAEIMIGDFLIPRSMALMPAASRMESAYNGQYRDLQKGRAVDLICVAGAKRQYLKPLFSKPDSKGVKLKYDLISTVRGLALQAHPKADEIISTQTYSALATLTHELFENTQEHATSDVQQIPYRRHIEAVFVSWLTLSDSTTRQDFSSNSLLRDYWASVSDAQSTTREAAAGLCFSFLDSGPGMAARFLSKDYFQMSSEEERAALLNCLNVHQTTKNNPAAGLGLSEVLTELKALNGLLRIRSGRLSIFKCFPPGNPKGLAEEEFLDWFEDRKIHERVAGTLITVFIPTPRITK